MQYKNRNPNINGIFNLNEQESLRPREDLLGQDPASRGQPLAHLRKPIPARPASRRPRPKNLAEGSGTRLPHLPGQQQAHRQGTHQAIDQEDTPEPEGKDRGI